MAYIYATHGYFAVRIPVLSCDDPDSADAATIYSCEPDALPDGAWVPLWEIAEDCGKSLADNLIEELSIAVEQYKRERKEYLA